MKKYSGNRHEKFLESKKKSVVVGTQDAKITFIGAPYISLQNRYIQTPLQKTYKISTGAQSFNNDFLGASRQFNWLELLTKVTNIIQYMTVPILKKQQYLLN